MNPLETRQQVLLGLVLVALMAATRGQHFAVLSYLPDASLAAFFLAGIWLRPGWAFPALFGVAALIDSVAVGWGGVSSFCITPAYALLIPAYGALWAAGRWYAGHHRLAWSALPRLLVAAAVGGTLNEVLATGGFYLFSGHFGAPSLAGVTAGVLKYLPATLTYLAFYLGAAAAVYLAVTLGAGKRAETVTR